VRSRGERTEIASSRGESVFRGLRGLPDDKPELPDLRQCSDKSCARTRNIS
jgi:hypothetical protein